MQLPDFRPWCEAVLAAAADLERLHTRDIDRDYLAEANSYRIDDDLDPLEPRQVVRRAHAWRRLITEAAECGRFDMANGCACVVGTILHTYSPEVMGLLDRGFTPIYALHDEHLVDPALLPADMRETGGSNRFRSAINQQYRLLEHLWLAHARREPILHG